MSAVVEVRPLPDILNWTDMNGSRFAYNVNMSGLESIMADFTLTLYTYNEPVVIALLTFYVPIFLLALIGNIMVLIVTFTSGGIRNVTNSFLLNLTCSDILVTTICIPLSVSERMYKAWIYGEIMCKTFAYLQGVAISASVLTIVALSFDRYLAINHPVKSRTISTTMNVRFVIVAIWLMSAVAMLPLCLVRRLSEHRLPHGQPIYFCHERWASSDLRKLFDVFLFVFIYVIPGAIVVTLYSRTGCHLLRSDQRLRRQDSDISSAGRMMAGRKRVARMLLILAALFALSWMPYHIIILYMDFVRVKSSDEALVALYFALLVGHSHSAQNPIVYCVMNRSFRTTLIGLANCRLPKKTPLSREGSVFSRFSPKRRRSKARSVIGRTYSEERAKNHENYNNTGLTGHKTVYRYSSNNSADINNTHITDAFTAGTANETTRIKDGQQRFYGDSDDFLRVQRRAQAIQMDVVWNQDGDGHVTTILHHDDTLQT